MSVINVYDKCEAVTTPVSTTKHREYVTSDEIESIINTALSNNTVKQHHLTTSIEQQLEQLNHHLPDISQLTTVKRAMNTPVNVNLNDDSQSYKSTHDKTLHHPITHQGPTCEPYADLMKDFLSQEDKSEKEKPPSSPIQKETSEERQRRDYALD